MINKKLQQEKNKTINDLGERLYRLSNAREESLISREIGIKLSLPNDYINEISFIHKELCNKYISLLNQTDYLFY